MVQKRVDQGSGGSTGSGVDDKARRFVDYDEGAVFVDNIQRDRLRHNIGRRCIVKNDIYQGTSCHS